MGWPICIVDVYGRETAWEWRLEGSGDAPSGDLLAVRTEKQLGVEAAAGLFDLRLTAKVGADGRTWMDRLAPQDVVVIQMMNFQGRVGDHGAGELHTVLIGLVDTITETMAITPQGLPERQIRVSGRDAGKLFISGVVTYFSFAGASMLRARDFIPQARLNALPHQVIARLLEDIHRRFLQIQVHGPSGPVDFWDLLGYRLESFSGEIPAGLDWQFLGGEGSFWSFYVKAASPPFHELFVDTRRTAGLFDGQGLEAKAPVQTLGRDGSAPVLILRPTPFPALLPAGGPDPQTRTAPAPDGVDVALADVTVSAVTDPWTALPTHVVGADALLGEPFQDVLSRSDQEQYTVYLAFSHYNALGREMALLTIPPILDLPKFRRYGYKPLMPNTWLTNTGLAGDRDMVTFTNRLTWRLASWYCLNDRFLSGYQTFPLLPHVHIGEQLLDQTPGRPPRRFYIERVSHQFVAFEQATTTLGLTRGLPEAEYERIEALLQGAELTRPAHSAEMATLLRDLMQLGQRP